MKPTQMFGFTQKCPLREAMAPHFTGQLEKLVRLGLHCAQGISCRAAMQ